MTYTHCYLTPTPLEEVPSNLLSEARSVKLLVRTLSVLPTLSWNIALFLFEVWFELCLFER